MREGGMMSVDGLEEIKDEILASMKDKWESAARDTRSNDNKARTLLALALSEYQNKVDLANDEISVSELREEFNAYCDDLKARDQRTIDELFAEYENVSSNREKQYTDTEQEYFDRFSAAVNMGGRVYKDIKRSRVYFPNEGDALSYCDVLDSKDVNHGYPELCDNEWETWVENTSASELSLKWVRALLAR
ncbi:MAG: hypothetical protein LBK56_06720 [Gracilibacteraceae bacterium]|jgi:hypothetical protein|nr:hypothetical protein [Gracilibacteraceae bacterium]